MQFRKIKKKGDSFCVTPLGNTCFGAIKDAGKMEKDVDSKFCLGKGCQRHLL